MVSHIPVISRREGGTENGGPRLSRVKRVTACGCVWNVRCVLRPLLSIIYSCVMHDADQRGPRKIVNRGIMLGEDRDFV